MWASKAPVARSFSRRKRLGLMHRSAAAQAAGTRRVPLEQLLEALEVRATGAQELGAEVRVRRIERGQALDVLQALLLDAGEAARPMLCSQRRPSGRMSCTRAQIGQ